MEFRELPGERGLRSLDDIEFSVRGSLAPAVEWILDGSYTLFFEHYVLMYRDPNVAISGSIPKGAMKRMIGKMPIILARASGRGRVALGRGAAGEIVGVPIAPGQTLEVREHQFLAATDTLSYGFTRVRGLANLLFGGNGFFVDTFHAGREAGVVWVHVHGNAIEVELGPGEHLDVEPSRWCYKDPSVKMTTVPINVSAGLFASSSFALNRFTGPGRVGLQTMGVYLETDSP
ncbi:AIM24 family protein [Sulfobacillus harzensis]|uniref:AIM24 family protein n=1 Tax=Sulfobacillus harzensis TaxID=2729629 RepID=A0A7Y0L2D5_9FIRM|nr:AIM24 family protein [Sulfobacillus harzensis]NMP21461.1 AIM24 family protein [Sulfobacillus harzensis]